MNHELYTLKEMAKILSSSFEGGDAEKCARKIRHWTLMDLLTPHGSKHTGTGVSRKYSLEEIRKAAILIELSRWKVPMTLLDDIFDTMIDEYADFDEWAIAIEAQANVFLSMSWTEDFVTWHIGIHEPCLGTVAEPDDPNELDDSGLFPRPASAIVINLTRIFQRLKLHED